MKLLPVVRKIWSFSKAVDSAMGLIAGIITMVLVAIISYEVFLRYVFNRPPSWAFDVCTFLLLVVAMFSGAYTMGKDGHISFDMVTDRLSPRLRRLVIACGSFCGLIYCYFLVQESIKLALRSIKFRSYAMAYVRFPEIYLFLVMIVGALFLFLTFLIKILGEAFDIDRKLE
jgi:TRAP-type C4-dicarboxylate transport system permease small subunit